MDEVIINIRTQDPSKQRTYGVRDKSAAPDAVNHARGLIKTKVSKPKRTVKTKQTCLADEQPAQVPSNPLQFPLKQNESKRNHHLSVGVADSADVASLMNTPVEPRIEPVFSNKTWQLFAQKYNIHPYILSCLVERFRLKRLTAIQEVAIPQLLKNKHCLIRAQTGSGKTLAYAVPLLNRLMALEPPVTRADGPLALVVLPTRELATQTLDVFHVLSRACVRIVPGCLIGGMKRKPQKVSLRKGLNIVIGTPQRILDHILRTASLQLANLRFFVIDEADRLLEMGFERNVRQIVEHIQSVTQNRSSEPLQTSLLSATLTSGVEKLAGLALHDPVHCTVSDVSPGPVKQNTADSHSFQSDRREQSTEQFAMPAGLRHFVLLVPWKLRVVALAAFLLLKCRYHKSGGKLIVFMATQHCVDFHYRLFQAILCPDDEENIVPTDMSKLSLYRLHGSMEHSEREKVFHKFSTGASGVLITTDVASRGLDLASVAWVVQYHMTGGPVDYVHRVGRTARAGGQGKALIILDQQEAGLLQLLRARAGVVFETLNLLDLMQTALFYVKRHPKRSERKTQPATVEEGVSRFSHLMLEAVAEDDVLSSLAETAYVSFIRSYASLSLEMRPFLMFKRLHLGHVARAFCLRSAPKDVASRVTGRLAGKRRALSAKRGAKAQSKLTAEPGDTSARQDSSLAFSEKRMRLSRGRREIKPAEKAKQNMLAEFGL